MSSKPQRPTELENDILAPYNKALAAVQTIMDMLNDPNVEWDMNTLRKLATDRTIEVNAVEMRVIVTRKLGELLEGDK